VMGAQVQDQPIDELAARREALRASAQPLHWLLGHAGRLTPAALPKRCLTDTERDLFADLAITQWLTDLQRACHPRRRHGRAEDPGADDASGRTRAERASLVDAAKRCNDAAMAAARLRLQMLANGNSGGVDRSALVAAMNNVGAWRELRVGVITEARLHKPDCRDKAGRVLGAGEMHLCRWRRQHRDQRSTIGRWLAPLGLPLADIALIVEPDTDATMIADRLVYANHDAAQLDGLAINLVRLGSMLASAGAAGKSRRGRKKRWPTHDLLVLAKVAGITQRTLAEQIADRVWSDELRDLLAVDASKIHGAPGARQWRISVLERHFGNVRNAR